jgi:FAD/FMN-containing dehydrogenase
MTTTSVLTTKGTKADLSEDDLAGLKAQIRGKLIMPSDGEKYEQARAIWNGMIDRRPGLIVECTGHADVVYAVKFARQHSLKVTIRGGGHQFAGRSIQDHAMLIDNSKWRSVQVDLKSNTVSCAPGATLGDLDHETALHGMVVPTGVNSTT